MKVFFPVEGGLVLSDHVVLCVEKEIPGKHGALSSARKSDAKESSSQMQTASVAGLVALSTPDGGSGYLDCGYGTIHHRGAWSCH